MWSLADEFVAGFVVVAVKRISTIKNVSKRKLNLSAIRCGAETWTDKFVKNENLVHAQGAGRIKSIYLKQTQGSVKFVTSLFRCSMCAFVFFVLFVAIQICRTFFLFLFCSHPVCERASSTLEFLFLARFNSTFSNVQRYLLELFLFVDCVRVSLCTRFISHGWYVMVIPCLDFVGIFAFSVANKLFVFKKERYRQRVHQW